MSYQIMERDQATSSSSHGDGSRTILYRVENSGGIAMTHKGTIAGQVRDLDHGAERLYLVPLDDTVEVTCNANKLGHS